MTNLGLREDGKGTQGLLLGVRARIQTQDSLTSEPSLVIPALFCLPAGAPFYGIYISKLKMDKNEARVGGGRQRSCHAKELGFSSVDYGKPWKNQ